METNPEMNNEQSGGWVDPNQDPQSDQTVVVPKSPDIHPNDSSLAEPLDKPDTNQQIKQAEIQSGTKPVGTAKQVWFAQEEIDDLRSRWKAIQSQFVDEPCSAVEQGETLVAETVERVKQMISDQMQALGQQWLNNDNISTEELRNTLLNYRSFLDRLLKQ